jgi:hypothetical protein
MTVLPKPVDYLLDGPWPNGDVKGRPSEAFRNHVFVSPHHYGAEGMWGVADYQERAGQFAAELGHPPDTTRDVMRDNGMRLVGLSQS